MNLNTIAREQRLINRANGFDLITRSTIEDNPKRATSALALIHSEVSEALEELRQPEFSGANFLEELADVILRTCDLAGGLTDNFESYVLEKMEKNRNRPHKHGDKLF